MRPRQLAGQVAVRLGRWVERPERSFARPASPAPGCRWSPRVATLPPGPQDNSEAELLQGRIRFLSQALSLGWPPPWRLPDAPRLWQYNLHYFEYLWALPYDAGRALVRDWIREHPLARGAVGWEPYPVSLRLPNWCAYFFERHARETARDTGFREELWGSIERQTRWLASHLETHLLANHLLENACALAFCGACFEGEHAEGWKALGLRLLEVELREQVGADGCHFEQSPMYHARVVYALTALLNTGDADLARCVEPTLDRMLRALRRLQHPDGGLALLNDSALSTYNAPAMLLNWWGRVSGKAPPPPEPGPLFALSDAGYYGAQHADGGYVICDAGAIRPAYQPGHAHGDLFSFELSYQGQRVICDAGVFGYEDDALRRYGRSTRAHNTVEVAGEDQSEFWAVHRVARRATPRDVRWEPTDDGFVLEAWHDGYERLASRSRHHRRFRWHASGDLLVVDRVTSTRATAVVSRLHLHPDCVVECDGDRATGAPAAPLARVRAPGLEFCVAFAGEGRLAVEPSIYCPDFGVELDNRALTFSATGADVRMGFVISRRSADDARSLSDALLLP